MTNTAEAASLRYDVAEICAEQPLSIEVLQSHPHRGALLQNDSPSFFAQRALNKPTQLQACVTLLGDGMCGSDQHRPEEGADGVPCSDRQHPWQVLAPQGFYVMQGMLTLPPPERPTEKELLSADCKKCTSAQPSGGTPWAERSTKVTGWCHEKGIPLLQISSWLGFVELPAQCERFGLRFGRLTLPSPTQGSWVCSADAVIRFRCQGSLSRYCTAFGCRRFYSIYNWM